jgi:putative transposase
VRASFIASDRTCGARRVWRDMLEEGVGCGLHQVERAMRLQALRSRPRRRRLPPGTGARPSHAIASNVLDRRFEAAAPNRKWVADFTYIWTAEGWLHVAAVLDLFSRRAAGGRPGDRKGARPHRSERRFCIAIATLPIEMLRRPFEFTQYTSEQFQRLTAANGVTCSMSRAGNVWDNAAMESFFATLKTERTAHKLCRTRNHFSADVFDYIERFCNPKRRHSTLGYLRPAEFERRSLFSLGCCQPNRQQFGSYRRLESIFPDESELYIGKIDLLEMTGMLSKATWDWIQSERAPNNP